MDEMERLGRSWKMDAQNQRIRLVKSIDDVFKWVKS